MAFFTGLASPTSITTLTIPCGFQPLGVQVVATERLSTPDNVSHMSIGTADTDMYQQASSTFADGTTRRSFVRHDRLVSIHEKVNGILTEVNAAQIESFTSNSVKIKVINATVPVKYAITVYG